MNKQEARHKSNTDSYHSFFESLKGKVVKTIDYAWKG